jgi:hypothetical protein
MIAIAVTFKVIREKLFIYSMNVIMEKSHERSLRKHQGYTYRVKIIKNNAALNILISLIWYIIYKSSVLHRHQIMNRSVKTNLQFLKSELIFRNEIYGHTRMTLGFKMSSYINQLLEFIDRK